VTQHSEQVKHALEQAFDIPFFVNGGIQGGDPWFEIGPENDDQGLFKLNVSFKNATRVIIDFIPEKYSASLITDMSKASADKKLLFTEFADLLEKKKLAHIDFLINSAKYNPSAPDTWPADWKSLSCRITRSPVTGDDEEYDLVNLTNEWAGNVLAMFLSLMHVVPVDNDTPESVTGYTEGKAHTVQSMRYERNPLNRRLCIASKGYTCSVCGFKFSATYGEIGNGYIEVHHIEPLSMMVEERVIDPIIDLTPVCSNCHSMLHRRNPPLHPDELRKMLGVFKQRESSCAGR